MANLPSFLSCACAYLELVLVCGIPLVSLIDAIPETQVRADQEPPSCLSRLFCCFGRRHHDAVRRRLNRRRRRLSLRRLSLLLTARAVLQPHADVQEYLLPPLEPEYSGKKCLVLDLDETLVHSSFKVRLTLGSLSTLDVSCPVCLSVHLSVRPSVYCHGHGSLRRLVCLCASWPCLASY